MGKRSRQKRKSVARPKASQPEPEPVVIESEPIPEEEPPAVEAPTEPMAKPELPREGGRQLGWTTTCMLILVAWLLGLFVRLYWVEEAVRPERQGEYFHAGEILPNTHDSYYFGAIIQKGHLGMHANNTRVPNKYREGMITLLPVAVLDYFNRPVFRELNSAREQLSLAVDDLESGGDNQTAAMAGSLREITKKLEGPFFTPRETRETALATAESMRQQGQQLTVLRKEADNENALTRAGPALEAAQEHATKAGQLPMLSVENLMIYLPAFVSPLLAVPLVLIGRLYGAALWGFFGAVLAVVANSYYNRSLAGYFDTDIFSVTLPACILYLLLYSIRRNSLWVAVCAGVLMFVFPLFYRSSLPIIYSMGFCYIGWQLLLRFRKNSAWQSVVPVGLGMIFAPASWGEYIATDFDGWLLRLAVVLGAGLIIGLVPWFRGRAKSEDEEGWRPVVPTCVAAVLVAGATLYFTNPMQIILQRVTQYSSAATATETQQAGSVELKYKKVITTVQEARRGLSAKQVAWRASGSSLACLLALLGYALLVARHPEFLVALPLIGIGFYTFMGGLRFTEHAVGIAGLSLAYIFFYGGTSRLGRTVLACMGGGLVGGLAWFWLGKMTGATTGVIDAVLLLPGALAGMAALLAGTKKDSGRAEWFQNSCLAMLGTLGGIAAGKVLMADLNKDALGASFTAVTFVFTMGSLGLAAVFPWMAALMTALNPEAKGKGQNADELRRIGVGMLRPAVRVWLVCLSVALVGGLSWGWLAYEPLEEMYKKSSAFDKSEIRRLTFEAKNGDKEAQKKLDERNFIATLSKHQEKSYNNIETIYKTQRSVWHLSLLTNGITRADLGNTVMRYVTTAHPQSTELRRNEIETILQALTVNARFRELFHAAQVNKLSPNAELRAAATKPLGAGYVLLGVLIGLVTVSVGGQLQRAAQAALAGGSCLMGLVIGATTQTGYLGLDPIGSFAGLSFLWLLLALGAAVAVPLLCREAKVPLARPLFIGLMTAVAGAMAWFLFTRITGHQVHFLFWPIGAMVGWLVARGCREESPALPFIAGAAGFLSVLLGKYFWFDIASGQTGNTLGGLAQDYPNNYHLVWMFPALMMAALMPMLLKQGERIHVAWSLLGGLLAAGAGAIFWALLPLENSPVHFMLLLPLGLMVGWAVRAFDEGDDRPSRVVLAGSAAVLAVLLGLAARLEVTGVGFSIAAMVADPSKGHWAAQFTTAFFFGLAAVAGAAVAAWFFPRTRMGRPMVSGLAVVAATLWLLPYMQRITISLLPGISLEEYATGLQFLHGLALCAMGAGVGLACGRWKNGNSTHWLVGLVVTTAGVIAAGMLLHGHDWAVFQAWAQGPSLIWIILAGASALVIAGWRQHPDDSLVKEMAAGLVTCVLGGLLAVTLNWVLIESLHLCWLALGTGIGLVVSRAAGKASTRASIAIAPGATLLAMALGTTALSPGWQPFMELFQGNSATWAAGGIVMAGLLGFLGTIQTDEMRWLRTAGAGLTAALAGALGWAWLAWALDILPVLPAWPLGLLVGLAVARGTNELPGWAGPVIAVSMTIVGCLVASLAMGGLHLLQDIVDGQGWLWLALGAGTAALAAKVFDTLPSGTGRTALAAGLVALLGGLAWAMLAAAMNTVGIVPGSAIYIEHNLPSPLTYGPWLIGALAGVTVTLILRKAAGFAASLVAMTAALVGIGAGIVAMGGYGGMHSLDLIGSLSSWSQLQHMTIPMLAIVGLGVLTAGALPVALNRGTRGMLVGWPVAILVVVGLLVPCLLHARGQSQRTIPVLYGNMVELLDKLKQKTKPGDYMLTWWDYGTAGWFHSEAKVICHPGDQSDDVYVVAKIFNETNQTTAANLALLAVDSYAEKGPAVGGPLAIHQIFKDLGPSTTDDWTALPSVAQAGPRGILRQIGQPDYESPGQQTNRNVFLYLPDNLVRIVQPIRQFSNRDLLDAKKEHQIGLGLMDESKSIADKAKRREHLLTAMEWFQQAAEKGHVPSQINMAKMHYQAYDAGLDATRAKQMLDAEERKVFKTYEGIVDAASKGNRQALKSLATTWLNQQEKGRGQGLLEAFQWICRANIALASGNAQVASPQGGETFAPGGQDAIQLEAKRLQLAVRWHLDGLALMKPEDLRPPLRHLHSTIVNQVRAIEIQAATFQPRGEQHTIPLFQTFRTMSLIPTHHDPQPRAVLLNGQYLAIREDLHVYQRTDKPQPKPGQAWAVLLGNRIVSGMYLGEDKDKTTGAPLIVLKTSGTPKKPGRNIAVPRNAIARWFGQWQYIDHMAITTTDPKDPSRLKTEHHHFNPAHNPWKRNSTGLYLVLPFDLYDPPGAAILRDYQPFCLMHRDWYETTLVKLLIGDYNPNLFELISTNKAGRLYRVKRLHERKGP